MTPNRGKRGKSFVWPPTLVFGVLSLIANPALSGDRLTLPTPSTPSSPMVIKVQKVCTNFLAVIRGEQECITEAGIGDRVQVQIQNLAEAMEKDGLNPRKLTLYLDGRVMHGVYAQRVGDPTSNLVEFTLERTDKSKEDWLPLLGSPHFAIAIRTVTLSVGEEDNGPISAVDPNPLPKLNLRVFHVRWFVGCMIGFVVLLVLFIWRARRDNILRDTTLVRLKDANKRPPYSLARFQMAVWLFLILGSALFIYLVTGDYNIITDQALVLMGIGVGTALGASAVDVGKLNAVKSAQASLAGLKTETAVLSSQIDSMTKLSDEKPTPDPKDPSALAGLKTETAVLSSQTDSVTKLSSEKPPPDPRDPSAVSKLTIELGKKQGLQAEAESRLNNASSAAFIVDGSEGFLLDVLSDANGVNVHRFQMLVVTVVLGILFCVGVYRNLAMPEFDTNLLALMGISSGAYLGLKIPESQG